MSADQQAIQQLQDAVRRLRRTMPRDQIVEIARQVLDHRDEEPETPPPTDSVVKDTLEDWETPQ